MNVDTLDTDTFLFVLNEVTWPAFGDANWWRQRQQDGQVFFFSFFDLSVNLSADNDCQNGPKKSHRPKRAKKLLQAIEPAGQCYRSQQWRRNLNGDTVFSCSMPARCCDWNHFWNKLVWDLPSGKYFQILEDRILLHFGNRSLACSVTQAEEKFCNRLKLAPLQIEICKRVFRKSGMKLRRQRINFLTSFRKQDSIMADR